MDLQYLQNEMTFSQIIYQRNQMILNLAEKNTQLENQVAELKQQLNTATEGSVVNE